jgi:putative ABC transport system ATP-binding protein
MSVTLEVTGLCKTYGEGAHAVDAVSDVSFSTTPGEFVAIVGPSGSGKTTLLAMVGALLTPTSGAIAVNGKDIARLTGRQQADYRRRSVGYVFQSNNLVPFLTARENLMLMASISGSNRGEAAKRSAQLLSELGLEDRADAIATDLSGGERQRVAIARALMNESQLVLVDEPTASLDSGRGKQVVESLMEEVKSREKIGLMVTHDMAMAKLADRVLTMHDGRMSEVQPTSVAETDP